MTRKLTVDYSVSSNKFTISVNAEDGLGFSLAELAQALAKGLADLQKEYQTSEPV